MQYEEGERDFVMLQHKFGIEWADGRKETRTSTLCEYGEKVGSGGNSAMAKLVGVPCGVAVKMVLDGRIKDKVSSIRFPRWFPPLLGGTKFGAIADSSYYV